NNRGGHHLEIGGAYNVTVSNCDFKGQYSMSSFGKEAIQIDATLNSGAFPNFKKYDGTACNKVKITGNRFYNVCRGVGSHRYAKGYYRNIIITNNSFDKIKYYAVDTMGYRTSAIARNTVINSGGGILVRGSHYINIYDNNISTKSASAVNITAYSSKIKVYRNTIHRAGNYGIVLSQKSKAISVSNNILKHTAKSAIKINNKSYAPVKSLSKVSISKVYLSNNSLFGSTGKKKTIYAKVSGEYYGKGISNSKGKYRILCKQSIAKNRISVYIKDKKGNISITEKQL
ncbi:MAG: right-handed parallel beta-helix repeat-containing protein, partial [Anaerovoracaceae bacterium]